LSFSSGVIRAKSFPISILYFTNFITFVYPIKFDVSEFEYEANHILASISFREGVRGANAWLGIPNDVGVFHGGSSREGVCCVHPVQAYLDLLRFYLNHRRLMRSERPERVGKSKLSVVRDGVNFLRSILDIGVSFRPLKLLAIPGLALIAAALGYGVPLWVQYLRSGAVAEDRVYRILFIIAAFNIGAMILGLGALLEQMARMLYDTSQRRGAASRLLERHFNPGTLAAASAVAFFGTLLTAICPLVDYITTGAIVFHWTWLALSAFFAILGAILLTFAAVDYTLLSMRRIATGQNPAFAPAEE